MLSAIIGDTVGSTYESGGNKNPDVPLKTSEARFTDDTVCTLAVAQWLMAKEDGGPDHPGQALREWTRNHRERGFGANFLHWAMGEDTGSQESWGNGAAMRVSPVAFWALDGGEADVLARASTSPTHTHSHSRVGAMATAWAIREAFSHRDPERLLHQASEICPYGDLITRDPVAERAGHEFDITVHGTVPLAMVLAARGGSFAGTLELAVSMGGDADTLAAIAAPIAEGLYGLDEDLAQWALRRQDLWFDPAIWPTVLAFQAHPRVQAFYARHGRAVPDVEAWWNQGPSAPGDTGPAPNKAGRGGA